MKQFASIQKIDTGILYALELTASVSVLLLAFGLVASMVNVLTKGTLLTDNGFMQSLYAWSQCIGIDASIPGAIMRTLYYYRQREWSKAGVYTLLSVLLLFTACLVSNIESIQQTLNITLSNAYQHVFIPIEGLIWIRSITVVLLVVVHAIRHVDSDLNVTIKKEQSTNGLNVQLSVQNQTILVEQQQQPDQISVQEFPQEQKALPAPARQKLKAEENLQKVRAYLADHPKAKAKELVSELSLSMPTIRKYMKEVNE